MLVGQQDHATWHEHLGSSQYSLYIYFSVFRDERTSITFSFLLKTPHTTMRVCFFFLLIFCNHFCHLKEISFKWICGNLILDILNSFNDLISIIQGSWEKHWNWYLHRHAEIIRPCLGMKGNNKHQGKFFSFNLTYILGLYIILNKSKLDNLFPFRNNPTNWWFCLIMLN